MAKRRETENEQKLTVLFTLQALGQVTDHQLLLFMTVCDIMNWFDMKLGLLDLEDEHLVIRQAHPLGQLYVVTENGRFCLKQFEGRIPHSKRETILQKAASWSLRFRDSQQSPAEIYVAENGNKWLQLRMTEGEQVLMDIAVCLPEDVEVHKPEEKWKTAAPEIYRELLHIFEAGQGETGVVSFEQENVSLTMFLTADPEFCREKWRDAAMILRERIIEMCKKDELYTKKCI